MMTVGLTVLSVLVSGGVFGFFYTWSFVVIRGLGLAEPRGAITTMQAINANIVEGWFAVLFFGTPVITALAAVVAWYAGRRDTAVALGLAAVVYLLGCFSVTVVCNIPLNNALALLDAQTVANPAAAWAGFAGPWTVWNHVRTAACFGTFLLSIWALWRLRA